MIDERKSRIFYAIDDNEIKKVTGYETIADKDAWWCPELGSSLWIGHQLFDTYAEAKIELIKDIDKHIIELQSAKKRLLETE